MPNNHRSITDLVDSLGGLKPGQLGFIASGHGIGKSALVAELAVARALKDHQILHIALNESVPHARAHYDEAFSALEQLHRITHDQVREVERHRLILSFASRQFDMEHLETNLSAFTELAGFAPTFVVVDEIPANEVGDILPALEAFARKINLPMWLTIDDGDHLAMLGEHCALGVVVTAEQSWFELAVSKGPAIEGPVSFELVRDIAALPGRGPGSLRSQACTLLSGGSNGAEAAFGAAAEKWGMSEKTMSFDGHQHARTRGLEILTEHQLASGDVSLAYVSQKLHRSYSNKALIKKVLQTLWHVVSRAQQVFVVGEIQDDHTVTGGTGWSVELAKMWHKPLWVFDQSKNQWFAWNGDAWEQGEPVIQYQQIAGTGTRNLTDEGNKAITALFKRSFGG